MGELRIDGAALYAVAKARGFPRAQLSQGIHVPAGETAWRLFCGDVQNAEEWFPRAHQALEAACAPS